MVTSMINLNRPPIAGFGVQKCVNTPFDLVIASEDSRRVNANAVIEINRVWSAIASQLDIGGQHRVGYITITPNNVITNFDLTTHTTDSAIVTAFTAVPEQSNANGNARIAQGLDAIRTQLDNNQRQNAARYGLVLSATLANNNALRTASQANADITMFAIGIGDIFSNLDRAISTIVRYPPVDKYRRALMMVSFNQFRDNVVENATLRLFCPGDIGGRCGRDTVCDKAANTICVQQTCKCNQRLQNVNGVCVTGPVINQPCNLGECSVFNSECVLGVCACIEGFTARGTFICDSTTDEIDISKGDRIGEYEDITIGVLAAVFPFLITGINLVNPSTLAAVARR
ncbi:uncharacterized protein LOC132556108 [Ylistrum balloti]|uniref:uncharacterized protein LOC132556108 n=1 Tax=Ylistrum balloti TaxID=509963 RepID=UPI002905D06D|nr:uncharacterized protein LOC132556108 [Ylistrum balloti]